MAAEYKQQLKALKGAYNLEEIIKVENLPDNISFHLIK